MGANRTARYSIQIGRDRIDQDQVVVRVIKGWWAGPGVGGKSRLVAEHWMSAAGMNERDAILGALADAAAALRDELA